MPCQTEGTTLTISGRDEIVGAQSSLAMNLPRGDYVRISVADTGVGMSEATLAEGDGQLAVLYNQRKSGKGTGLRAVDGARTRPAQSGGTFHGDFPASSGRSGTTVSLWLPRARREDVRDTPQQPPPPSMAIESRGSRVSLVDDDPLVSTNTASMLMRSWPHRADRASSGPRVTSAGSPSSLML